MAYIWRIQYVYAMCRQRHIKLHIVCVCVVCYTSHTKCVVTCIADCTCCSSIYTLLGNVLFICKFVYNLTNAITIRI